MFEHSEPPTKRWREGQRQLAAGRPLLPHRRRRDHPAAFASLAASAFASMAASASSTMKVSFDGLQAVPAAVMEGALNRLLLHAVEQVAA